MIRLILVILTVAAVIALTLSQRYALAMGIGIVVGAVMFLLGMAAGGGLGNARAFDRKPQDVGARIGVALAAMSIAVEGLRADGPYPAKFRLFCAICQGLGALIALVLAVRYRSADPPPVRGKKKP
jgi:hypothetical protein